MNAIIGFSELAMLEPMPPEQYEYLHKIQNASKALLSIVNDVLDYSKGEAGKLNIECLPFNLEELLSNVQSIVQNQANAKKILFFSSSEPDVPMGLKGDTHRLSQILLNLLSNSIKFTEVGSVILTIRALELRPESVVVRFSVCDTGIGISEDALKNLFNPFTQADSSTTRKYGGTGLGLSICKQLAGLMGGSIQASSEPGKGSVFNFDIPFDIVHASADSVSVVNGSEFETFIGILDVHSKDVIYRVLSDSSMFMQFYSSSGEIFAAAEKMPENKLGIFIIDQAFRNEHGEDLIKKIKRLPNQMNPSFIVLKNPDVQIELISTKDNLANIIKPVSSLVLRKKLQILLDGMRSASADQKYRKEKLSISGLKILLVEDNEVNQVVGKGMLSALGASTVIAENGQVALEELARQGFDLVLMDLQMPVMGGIEATREIRKQAQFAALPIIALTAHAFAEEHQNCINAGMSDVLTKPITLNALRAKLEHYALLDKGNEKQAVWAQGDSTKLQTAIDVSAGLVFSGDDQKIYTKALSLYLEKLPASLKNFHQALAANDLDVARRAAHSLRGMSGAVGALRLQTLAGEIETALKNTTLISSNWLIQQFDQAVREVIEAGKIVLARF
jgi:CheY-like chemotaxis protein/HPt (histidine-containing phosphotransfer) domain-containing protein